MEVFDPLKNVWSIFSFVQLYFIEMKMHRNNIQYGIIDMYMRFCHIVFSGEHIIINTEIYSYNLNVHVSTLYFIYKTTNVK